MKPSKYKPLWLKGPALKEYRRLQKMRDFREDELDRLAEYASENVRSIRLVKAVEKEGEVLISPRTGASYINPTTNLLQSSKARGDKLRKELFPPKPSTGGGSNKPGTLRDRLMK